jgi:hypothetical protein
LDPIGCRLPVLRQIDTEGLELADVGAGPVVADPLFPGFEVGAAAVLLEIVVDSADEGIEEGVLTPERGIESRCSCGRLSSTEATAASVA